MEPAVVALSVFVMGLYGSVAAFYTHEYLKNKKRNYKELEMTEI